MKLVKILGISALLVFSAFAAKKVYNHVIDQAICNQCGDCVKECPENAIKVTKLADGKVRHEIDPALCTQCGICIDKCKLEAIDAQEVKPKKK
ncbi:MAG: 4Fe-4S binding protein [Fibrobacter sp.]|nr:4Fe-4S binding protein [Fibrobacter sp.]